MKRVCINVVLIGILLLFVGCGINNDVSIATSESITEENEITTQEITTEVVTTEEPKREGSRNNPLVIGDDVDMHFFGYTIQSYGDINGKLIDYSDGKATFEYTLNSFGNDNPIYFPVQFNVENGTISEKNEQIYVYPCDDPRVFSVSDVDSFAPDEDVVIPCGDKGEVTYTVGEQKYLAVVWYTLVSDGGDRDFVDDDIYGHIAFYNLQN